MITRPMMSVQTIDAQQVSPWDHLLLDRNGNIIGMRRNKGTNGSGGAYDFLPYPIALSAAELASPSADVLADILATYCLNVPPYTRYMSTGTTLIALGTGGAAIVAKYASDFGALLTWSIPGVTHVLNTSDMFVQTKDLFGSLVIPNDVTIDPSSHDVTITWNELQAGRVMLLSAAVNPSKYAADMVSATTWTILGTTHALGTKDLLIQARDTQGKLLIANDVTVNSVTFDVTLTWNEAQAGRVVIQ